MIETISQNDPEILIYQTTVVGPMALADVPAPLRDLYEIHEYNHALAILMNDFPEEWQDIREVLENWRLHSRHILARGGGRSPVVQSLEPNFNALGWEEKKFSTLIRVDGIDQATPTHKIDCVKSRIAIEIEWSNKDPFYDRDLSNFRILHERGAISVGVIITKSDQLRPIMERLGVWSKYGTSTTWMNKLLPRINGGTSGGCPVLVFGIGEAVYIEDVEEE